MISRSLLAVSACAALTGCFGSENPVINADQAVLPVDHQLTICLEQGASCIELIADENGYRTAPDTPPDEVGRARFAPLVQSAGRQVYILEAQPQGGEGYIHLIARRASNPDETGSDLELAALDCGALSGEAEDRFKAGGGEIVRGMISTCYTPNLDVLRTAVLDMYGPYLGDDRWWAEMADE